jgi:putative oxidoreductase
MRSSARPVWDEPVVPGRWRNALDWSDNLPRSAARTPPGRRRPAGARSEEVNMSESPGRPVFWNVVLWLAQLLLGAAFGMAGFMKTTMPIPDLAAAMVWPGDIPPALVRFIGACESAAAIGLILPAATRIRPVLTPLAASGLLTIQGLAIVFHIVRGEFEALPINLSLGALAALVAWGRFRKLPIAPR